MRVPKNGGKIQSKQRGLQPQPQPVMMHTKNFDVGQNEQIEQQEGQWDVSEPRHSCDSRVEEGEWGMADEGIAMCT
jgi:hypothetical protein